MTQKRFEEVNNDLDFARHNLNELIALFGYKSNSMVCNNKTRALCAADCVIDLMRMVKEVIKNDV